MRRVATVVVLLALLSPIVAFVLRGVFGPGGAIAGGGVVAAAILAPGVPAYALFRRKGWLKWRQIAPGGDQARRGRAVDWGGRESMLRLPAAHTHGEPPCRNL